VTADVVAGRYRLEQRLSTTAMADVWLAEDDVLERQVVVKLLAPDADRPRFEREARAAAALAHPNIVQVFDYGEDEGRPYMVLEYLPGGTLAERLPEGAALSDEKTRRVATDIAAGLAHAHENGVVHRDLKPGNVLFDAEGRAKVADFGIAHVVGSDSLTDEGTVMGTAAYISPEQVAGGHATPATDVYAFGVLLYRLLSGRFPFESENALELARMHRDIEAPPVQRFRPDAPADLAALATAAVAKDPSARPPDGAALQAALEDREPPASRFADAATTRLPAQRRRRRSPLTYAIAGLLLVAAGVLTAAVITTHSHSSTPPVPSHARPTSTRHRTSSTTTPISTPSTPSTTETTTQKTQPTLTGTSQAPTTTAPTIPPTTTSTTTATTTATTG
jgi:eukaryotic-like serine/threonine-protein kinase